MKSNIFITGRSGVGKTAVSHRLKKTFPAGATIELDSLQDLLHTDGVPSSLQCQDVAGAASLIALHFVQCGYGPIVTVGYLTDHLLSEWEKAGAPGETRVYTLTASDEVLCRRNLSRSDSYSPGRTSFAIQRRLTPLFRTHRETVIDTSALDVDGVCKAIVDDLCREDEITCEDQNIFTYA